MATILYLNNSQVFPAGNQSIKLTKENPYFTQSGSYTLDVTLPMEILENRTFFANISRMEASKNPARMTCRLLVNNRLLLKGSARVTQVTAKEVKVQLLGGNSELNFISDSDECHIDRLELGQVVRNYITPSSWEYSVTTGIRFRQVHVNDETEGAQHVRLQFGLIDVARQIFSTLGFTVTDCSIDREPWNQIYIATAMYTYDVAHVLPHWTVRTFIDEFCKFFNVSVVINQEQRTVSIRENPAFYSRQNAVAIQPVEEYTAEMSEQSEAHALAADNIRFDISDSEHHDYDIIPDNVRENADTVTYASRTAALNAWNAASDDNRKQRIYACPVGKYTGWLHDYTDVGGTEEDLHFTQIDVFAPLVRNPDTDNVTELKICPVAIGEIDEVYNAPSETERQRSYRWRGHIPSLENPTGNEVQTTFGRAQAEEEKATIQEYVMGDADNEKAEKEDRMQVMFIDDEPQPYHYWRHGDGDMDGTMIAGFTDYEYKKAHSGRGHRYWSLALNPCNATYYLGQLHQNGFTFNLKAKQCFKFIARDIPDPTKVFIIRGKCYGCEKIETQIDSQGMQQLMTGYFYEMT